MKGTRKHKATVIKLTPQEEEEAYCFKIKALYTREFEPRTKELVESKDPNDQMTNRTKLGQMLTWTCPQFLIRILVFLPTQNWIKLQQVCLLWYQKLIPDLLSRCNSLTSKQIQQFIFTKPVEIYRSKLITNIQKLGEDMFIVSCNSGKIEIHQHMTDDNINNTKRIKVDNLTGVEWKTVTVAATVQDDLLCLATECGMLYLLSRKKHGVIDSVYEKNKITAMCHVSNYFIIVAHAGGYLSCWDVQTGKLVRTSAIKNLAAGEVTRITNSPNV